MIPEQGLRYGHVSPSGPGCKVVKEIPKYLHLFGPIPCYPTGCWFYPLGWSRRSLGDHCQASTLFIQGLGFTLGGVLSPTGGDDFGFTGFAIGSPDPARSLLVTHARPGW